MAEISELGSTVGWVYVTQPDGTTLVTSKENTQETAQIIKQMGVSAASLALNQSAVGTINITACTGVGNVTQVLINGVDQINATIAYTGATTPTVLAAAIVVAINSHTPAGYNYTALSIAGVVYVIAPDTAGSSVNGLTITVSNSGNLTLTTTDMAGGSDASNVYDQNFGYRFFINPTASAVEGDIAGATEITNYIVQRGVQAANDYQALTVATGVITPTRKSGLTYLIVDTEGAAAADDLTDITPSGWAEWDTVVIRGTDAARVVTVKTTGNISLAGSNDFATGDYTKTLTLQYRSGNFYETSRSTQQIGTVAAFRTASFPFTSQEGGATTAITAGGGIKTLTVNTDKKLQAFTGNVTLLADYEIILDTTGAVAGDEFVLGYTGTITLNGFNIKITSATTKTLTTVQALRGQLYIACYYNGATWGTSLFYNFFNVAPLPKIENQFIEDGTIDVLKLDTEARTEVIVIPISFETGYTNAVNKIRMQYAGSVVSMYAVAVKAIAGTDNATIQAKDNGSVNMTGGLLTFTASDAQNTIVSSAVTANNTFVDGDVLTFLSAKATAGGECLLTIEILRA